MAVFFASHVIPARPAVRGRSGRGMGHAGYGAAYGTVSLAILWWIIVAAGRAPFVPLWDPLLWHRWAVNGAMIVAVLLGTFAVGAVNPFSFGGRSTGFDPAHPGVAGVTRHPLLWALLIWALGHLLANGDLAHALVFGPFAAFAAVGMRAIDRRNQRLWGAREWARPVGADRVLAVCSVDHRALAAGGRTFGAATGDCCGGWAAADCGCTR